MTNYTVAVVSGGLSEPSSTKLLADRLAQAVRRDGARRGLRVEVVDVQLRGLARPIADTLVTGFPPPSLQEALDAVAAADALIAVTPVFSASYSGLFKSFFDVADPQGFIGKPVLLAATGGSARHSLMLDHAMRPLFAYLKAEPVATGVFAATADFGSDASGRGLDQRIDQAGRQLVSALADAAPSVVLAGPAAQEPAVIDVEDELADDVVARAAQVHLGPEPSRVEARRRRDADPFENLVPFEQLLRRS
jgi:FMN reductase